MGSEDMSGNQVRRVLAGALAGVARGLTASARMIEQTSWVLRPREPVAVEPRSPSDAAAEPPPPDIDALESADTEAETAETVEPADTEPETIESVQAEAVEPAVTELDPDAEPPPTISAPEGPDHARVAETHVAELADRPVADVVARIADLSTDELEQLYAHEVTHKNRKTVLRAIERAVQPASDSQ